MYSRILWELTISQCISRIDMPPFCPRRPTHWQPCMLRMQDVRKGMADFARFRAMMAGLLSEIKARGEPRADDLSIAAHLLRIRDATGQPLPDDRLAAEIGVFFTGGFETTGHTIGMLYHNKILTCCQSAFIACWARLNVLCQALDSARWRYCSCRKKR